MKKKAKKTLAQAKIERRNYRHYGRVTIRKGQKVAWVAKEDKNGWSLGLALSDHTRWLRNLKISSKEEVNRIIRANIVFIETKK